MRLQIQCKSLAIIIRPGDHSVLVHADDNSSGGRYARPLGGSIEFGELAVEALHREMLEELGCGLKGVRQLGIVENRFELNGKAGHEVIFAFRCDLDEASIYVRDSIPLLDVPGQCATWWRPDEGSRLVPEQLLKVLRDEFAKF